MPSFTIIGRCFQYDVMKCNSCDFEYTHKDVLDYDENKERSKHECHQYSGNRHNCDIDKQEEKLMNIPSGTSVVVDTKNLKIRGIIVGKATTDMTETHIIKCTDGQLPNDTYRYDTFVAPLCFIEIIK